MWRHNNVCAALRTELWTGETALSRRQVPYKGHEQQQTAELKASLWRPSEGGRL